MIGQSGSEYIFIRVCILGLHSIAPLCVLYCAIVIALYGFRTAITSPLPLLIEAIAAAEALFYFSVYLPHRHALQREAVHPPAPSREERRELFRLCNENIPDPEAYFRKWFLGADLKDIKRENVKDFLLWAFFNRGGPPGDDDEELEEYIVAAQKLLGRPIEKGRGSAICLRLTLDRVAMLHRSLVWYFCVGFVDLLTYVKLLLHGFHFHRMPLSRFFTLFPFRPQTLLTTYRSPAKYTSYWHRPHTSPTKLPILFIHGIGIGLYPYTNFLSELNSVSDVESADSDGQVGIIAIEIMPVSFRITHSALSRAEMCSEIERILKKHLTPGQKCVLVSHSYGSVVTTHLLHTPSTAALIGPLVLIDPVTILLHLPEVAYNFTRRLPKKANEHQLHYFGSMDMGVSHTLARNFFWSENVLWKKDLKGRRVTVSLAGKDLIVDTNAVGRYLNKDVPSGHASNGHATPNSHATDTDSKSNLLIDYETRTDLQEGHGSGSASRSRSPSSAGGESSNSSMDEADFDEWKSRPWRGTDIDVLWFADLDHAQVFDKKASRQRVIRAIAAYCDEG